MSDEHAAAAARFADFTLQIDLHKFSAWDTECHCLATSIWGRDFMAGYWLSLLNLSWATGFRLRAE